MGFFDTMKGINKVNTLLKQLEPKLDYIAGEIQYPYSANKAKLQVECSSVSVLMVEIMDVIEQSPRAVYLTHYYLRGRKLSIMEIASIAAYLVEQAERL